MSSGQEATNKPRTLVLCFDGTSSEYDGDNTNAVKFFALLKKDDFNEQLCYYQAGIGTFFAPGVVSPLFEWFAKIIDEAVAWYLDAHVMDGYRFLMQNYRVGDKICIFGFSRGAYTARALAGMLYKVGLLPKDNQEQIPFAYKVYKRDNNYETSSGFKRTFCQDVKIEFVGAWETVASVGIMMSRTLPFLTSNSGIKTFRQALALDEHRAKFRPNMYHRPTPAEAATSSCTCTCQASRDTIPSTTTNNTADSDEDDDKESQTPSKRANVFRRLLKRNGKTKRPASAYYGLDVEGLTDVMEVWFSGCHSDVGGGAVLNSVPNSLANITLRWMVREVINSECGILFDEEAFASLGLPLTDTTVPNPSDPADAIDALQPIHDDLVTTKIWWLLEVIPWRYSWQDSDGAWHSKFGWNLGRGREISDEHPKFHISVQERMKDPKLGYKPKAIWKEGSEVYVD